MVKITGFSAEFETQDPRTGRWTKMINVLYEEEGRAAGSSNLAKSSQLLDELLGEETGLPQIRSHTQPMRATVAKKLKVGQEFPLFISRGLYSLPDIRKQINVPPRMVGNRPTYFLTWLADKPEVDVDERLSNDNLAKIWPKAFELATVQNANMRTPGSKTLDIAQQDNVSQGSAKRTVPA